MGARRRGVGNVVAIIGVVIIIIIICRSRGRDRGGRMTLWRVMSQVVVNKARGVGLTYGTRAV